MTSLTLDTKNITLKNADTYVTTTLLALFKLFFLSKKTASVHTALKTRCVKKAPHMRETHENLDLIYLGYFPHQQGNNF